MMLMEEEMSMLNNCHTIFELEIGYYLPSHSIKCAWKEWEEMTLDMGSVVPSLDGIEGSHLKLMHSCWPLLDWLLWSH